MRKAVIHFDGSSGPRSGAGVVMQVEDSEPTVFCKALGSKTNNEAEYQAILFAIQIAKEAGVTHPAFRGDSRLVVMQVLGEWRVKEPHLKALHRTVMARLTQFDQGWEMGWVPRTNHLQSLADKQARRGVDQNP